MATGVEERVRSDAPTRSSERAPAGRLAHLRQLLSRGLRNRWALGAALVIAGGFLFLLTLTLGERILYRDRVLPGVEVNGLDTSGASEQTVYNRVNAAAQRLERAPLQARARSTALDVDPSVIDFRVDSAGTTRAARRAGRSGNPFDQVFDFVLRRFRTERIPLKVNYSAPRLQGVIDGWNAQVAKDVRDGSVTIDGATVKTVEPRAGDGILEVPARAEIVSALQTAKRPVVQLPMGIIRPTIDRAQIDATAARARAILSQPMVATVGTTTITIAPPQLGATLRIERRGRSLELSVDTDALRTQIAPAIAPLESPAKDASFSVNGASVSVVPSEAGKTVDLGAIAAAILRGDHTVNAPITDRQPERDTAWAQKLNITQQVSSFTTNYPCCQPRVTNIQRASSVVDGTIVEPGATFSLNEKLGKRTAEAGYVKAPVYSTDDGFFDDFGGGVSQFSTTLWNATFFGGYRDIAHTPHSLWISRYPKGREATLNWGSIDNKFQNDSDCGILIKTAAGPTSVTVSFYSCKDRSVRSDEPTVLEEIPIEDECVNDPALPVGAKKELEKGYKGYRVEYFRYVKKSDGPEKKERWAWTYDMRKRKVACGPATPPPAPAPTPVPAVPPATTASG
ncbi:MAG: VanW family protein [Acidimicrobiia bacterium]